MQNAFATRQRLRRPATLKPITIRGQDDCPPCEATLRSNSQPNGAQKPNAGKSNRTTQRSTWDASWNEIVAEERALRSSNINTSSRVWRTPNINAPLHVSLSPNTGASLSTLREQATKVTSSKEQNWKATAIRLGSARIASLKEKIVGHEEGINEYYALMYYDEIKSVLLQFRIGLKRQRYEGQVEFGVAYIVEYRDLPSLICMEFGRGKIEADMKGLGKVIVEVERYLWRKLEESLSQYYEQQ